MQEGRAEGQNVTKCRMGFTRVMSPTILYVYRNNTGGGQRSRPMKKQRSTLRGKQHGGRGSQRQDYGVIEAENKRSDKICICEPE